jgi:excisionase family DNA binding protein
MIRRESPSAAPKCDFTNLLFDKARTMLSLEEIAARLECSRAHVFNLIEGGDLGCINIGTGKTKYYRIPASEWEKFLKKRASV